MADTARTLAQAAVEEAAAALSIMSLRAHKRMLMSSLHAWGAVVAHERTRGRRIRRMLFARQRTMLLRWAAYVERKQQVLGRVARMQVRPAGAAGDARDVWSGEWNFEHMTTVLLLHILYQIGPQIFTACDMTLSARRSVPEE